DHGRAGGALYRRLHLGLDRGQGAFDDLKDDRVDLDTPRHRRLRSTRLPRSSTSTSKELCTTVVEPYSSITAGPSTRKPAGSSSRRNRRRPSAEGAARGRTPAEAAAARSRGRSTRPTPVSFQFTNSTTSEPR